MERHFQSLKTEWVPGDVTRVRMWPGSKLMGIQQSTSPLQRWADAGKVRGRVTLLL